jgi:Ca-activated chloride channel family protein
MSDLLLLNPHWLWLLAALPAVAALRRRRHIPALVVPNAHEWHRSTATPTPAWPTALAYVGVALLIIAMARPQLVKPDEDHQRRGYDVVIAIDLSTSMYAEDLYRGGVPVDRLQAIKPIIAAFINQRPNDRIGIVAFAGRAYTFAPLTFDHEWLRRQTARLSIGLVEDGTAIGDAIGVSLNRLREGWKRPGEPREGAFILLLTDGSNNRGALDPRQAARLAAIDSVTIFTVGAGADGEVPMPVFDYAGNRTGTEMQRSEIDVLALRDIAETTGGMFFRVTDENAIAEAFAHIDETTQVDFDAAPPLLSYEMFHLFLLLAMFCLGMACYGAHFRPGREEVFA